MDNWGEILPSAQLTDFLTGIKLPHLAVTLR